jgi:hypothetical protein
MKPEISHYIDNLQLCHSKIHRTPRPLSQFPVSIDYTSSRCLQITTYATEAYVHESIKPVAFLDNRIKLRHSNIRTIEHPALYHAHLVGVYK